jgi:four helix bundle protein
VKPESVERVVVGVDEYPEPDLADREPVSGRCLKEDDSEPYRTGERFERLEAVQLARQMAIAVYSVTRENALLRADRALCDQMRRAAVSVVANIAEGYERGSLQEYHRFLGIAKGSAGEVRGQLYVALDADLIDQATFDRLTNLAVRISQVLDALRESIRDRIEVRKSGSETGRR